MRYCCFSVKNRFIKLRHTHTHSHKHIFTFRVYFFVYIFFHKWFTGDSENDLKINIFLAAVESDVDLDADLDADADTDVVFKDPALVWHWMSSRGAHTKNSPSNPIDEYHPYTYMITKTKTVGCLAVLNLV